MHAGHEHMQQQWRHAKPYAQIAEDLIAEAQVLADRCDPPPPPPSPQQVQAALPAATPPTAGAAPAPAPAVVAVAPAPAQPRAAQRVALSAHIEFDFDRRHEASMRPERRQQLVALVHRVKSEGLQLRLVQRTGHADRLNNTGQASYNQRLSERRAATVLALLLRLGLPAVGVATEAVGNDQQVLPCTGRYASKALLQACLQPNRRVDVKLLADLPPR